MAINEIARMSRLIVNRSTRIERLELKKMFIIAMASVSEPTPEQKERALKELEKPFQSRDMASIIGQNNIIKIDKQDFFKYMKIDTVRYKTAHDTYKKLWTELRKNSEYVFDTGEEFVTGNFITSVYTNKKMSYYKITLDAAYMPIFWSLKGGYIKLLVEDVGGFDSNFTMNLYNCLVSHNDKKELDFTTKQLKTLFGLSEQDYMKSNGKFDRYNFEKRTIHSALKEIRKKCRNIVILPYFESDDAREKCLNDDGTYKEDELILFEKVKKNGKVDKYIIRYRVKDAHEVLNAEKKAKLPPEQEDPRVLSDEDLEIQMSLEDYNIFLEE